MDFIGERLSACLTLSMFSANVLDHPLLTASNTDPVSINFLCHRRIEERDGGSFPYLVPYLRWVWTHSRAFKKHIVKCKRKFRNQNFSGLKRKRKFRDQNFLSLKRKRKLCNQNFLSLKRKFRNQNSECFKAQTQIQQPKIESSTAQLQIDCLRSAHKFCYSKSFWVQISAKSKFKKRAADDGVKYKNMKVQTWYHLQLSYTGINQLQCI